MSKLEAQKNEAYGDISDGGCGGNDNSGRRKQETKSDGVRQGHTLQATALVNEVYLRLVDIKDVNWQDRAHFFAVSAQMMRRILVNIAHVRKTKKRGGAAQRITLDDVPDMSGSKANELIALDDALHELAKFDPRQAQVVELRFFGGFSVEETAEVLKISPQSVMRDWKLAKAWMMRELSR